MSSKQQHTAGRVGTTHPGPSSTPHRHGWWMWLMCLPMLLLLGALLAAADMPTVLVQEGGYAIDALSANLSSFLDGFEGKTGA